MRTSLLRQWAAIGVLAGGLAPVAAGAQSARPTATVTPVVESNGVHAGTTVRVAVQVSLPEGLHVQSNAPRDPSLIPTALAIDAPQNVRLDAVAFPATTDLAQVGQDQPLSVFEREFVIGVRLAIGSAAPRGPLTIPAHLRYQACNATTCFAPRQADFTWTLTVVPAAAPISTDHPELFDRLAFDGAATPVAATRAPAATVPATPASADAVIAQLAHFEMLGTAGGYLNANDFLAFVHNAETGTKSRGLLEGRGPLAIVLIVLLGGLALNLTPCVLPMIPINLAIIGAGAQAGSRARGFSLGMAYGAAMAAVYGVLGVVVIRTASTFGTINASPWFNLAIAALFVILALAMFDVVTIDFSRWSTRFGFTSHRGSFALAFGMGAVAALLAGACVAPVVIEVVLFSSNLYATGTHVALALPFVLGLGMALPWPVAGAGIAALPRPGKWMVRVKQAFAIVILVTAGYYAYVAYGIFANRAVDPAAVAASVQAQLKAGWNASLPQALAEAERRQQPVLVDLWATWCKNCLTMDETTLENADVKQALQPYVKVKFQAEDPDREPARSVMMHFGAVGLPTYVILRPKRAATSE